MNNFNTKLTSPSNYLAKRQNRVKDKDQNKRQRLLLSKILVLNKTPTDSLCNYRNFLKVDKSIKTKIQESVYNLKTNFVCAVMFNYI